MKIGVLGFSYAGFVSLERQIAGQGVADVNIGDNVQSLAVRRLLIDLGVSVADIISVDRDTLPAYDGPPVALVMNGCFRAACFPLPPQVHPIFIGFEAKEPVIASQRDMLARHQPIGCRDVATAERCRAHGIAAEVTGCLSLSFPTRPVAPKAPHLKVIYGAGVGAFPWEVLHHLPPPLLAGAEFVYQRRPVADLPLTPLAQEGADRQAAALLDRYAQTATLIVTSLHPAAAPCIAMGIPVVLCRTVADSRFSFLETRMPVHVRPFADTINWSPAPLDIGDLKSGLRQRMRQALARVAGRG